MGHFVKPHGARIVATLQNTEGQAKMPHVARVSWEEALERLFQKNAGTPMPSSTRALANALAQLKPDGPKPESWRTVLNKRVKAGRVAEEQAKLIAKAMGVPRSTLPAAEKVSLLLIYDRLEELEDGVAELLDGQRELLRRAGGGGAESLGSDAQMP